MKTRKMIKEIDKEMDKLAEYRKALELIEEIWINVGPLEPLTDEITAKLRDFMLEG